MDQTEFNKLFDQRIAELFGRDRFIFDTLIQILDGRNIQTGRGTGTQIGTAADQKVAFFGAVPVAQQSAITAPSGGTTTDTQARTAISAIIAALKAIGVTA